MLNSDQLKANPESFSTLKFDRDCIFITKGHRLSTHYDWIRLRNDKTHLIGLKYIRFLIGSLVHTTTAKRNRKNH